VPGARALSPTDQTTSHSEPTHTIHAHYAAHNGAEFGNELTAHVHPLSAAKFQPKLDEYVPTGFSSDSENLNPPNEFTEEGCCGYLNSLIDPLPGVRYTS